MRSASPGCDFRKAELKVRVAEQQRQDLALLLRSQDGKERRSRLPVHNLNSPRHFADIYTPLEDEPWSC
jgi:hypothetical protein